MSTHEDKAATASAAVEVQSDQPSSHGFRNKAGRVLWALAYHLLFKWIPRPIHAPRRVILRLFGAKIASTAKVAPDVIIWAPWNLIMEPNSVMGPKVNCYNVAAIRIGRQATVSQFAHLCAASHDHTDPTLPLTTAPITIEDGAWVCTDVFVSMGVTIGRNAVIGARAVVTRSMPAGMVCVGFPCKPLKPRFPEAGKP